MCCWFANDIKSTAEIKKKLTKIIATGVGGDVERALANTLKKQ